MKRALFAMIALAMAIAPAACVERQGAATVLPAAYSPTAMAPLGLRGRFKHIVIIVQENRTPDDLFHGLRGADTVGYGLNSKGQKIQLKPISVGSKYDIDHSHRAFATEFDGGKMDGFDRVYSKCSGPCPPEDTRMYGYVPRSQADPYFVMAGSYAFGDRMFQTNQGPSFPAHQYIISGTSTPVRGSPLRAAENPRTSWGGTTGGCDSPASTLVKLIDPQGNETKSMYPCFERPTIFDLLAAKHLTWRYYQAHKGAALWNAPDAIKHLRNSSGYTSNVVYPPGLVLRDAMHGTLADVSVVTPTADDSDHAQITNLSGPSWVANVVNAVGKSPYWRDTAIVVTWDAWGGWYDHVKPPVYNSYELGFRVPLIVISAYTHAGYVSHRQHEFGSILKLIEQNYGLGSLDTTDVRSDNLSDCFDFTRAPRKFVPIPAPRPMLYFLNEKPSNENPDDD